MFRWGIKILILSSNFTFFIYVFGLLKVKSVTFRRIILHEECITQQNVVAQFVDNYHSNKNIREWGDNIINIKKQWIREQLGCSGEN